MAGTGGGYAYDGNGNPTTYNGANLGFDARDNLVSAYGGVFTAGYTSEGVRAWKQIGAGQNAPRTSVRLHEAGGGDGCGVPCLGREDVWSRLNSSYH